MHSLVQRRRVRPNERLQPFVDNGRGVGLADAAKVAHLALQHVIRAAGPEGDGHELRPATPEGVHVTESGRQLVAPLLAHLGDEAALAQPGLADQVADAAVAVAQSGQNVTQAGDLARAADQRRAEPFQPAQPARLRLQPQHAVGVNRLLFAFDLNAAQVPYVEQRRD